MSTCPIPTLLIACLILGLPARAEAPADAVDAPLQLPGLIWEDALGVATSPWRCSPEDWGQFALGAAAVVGTALVLDHPVQKALQRGNTPALTRTANDLARFGNPYSFLIAGGFYATGYLMEDRELQAAGTDAIASLVVATAILVPLKYAFGRADPSEDLGNHSFKPLSSQDSFPSGHTTWAFTAAAAITEHYSEPWMQVTAYGLATLVGMARLEQNVHWTSDVLAGALIGTAVGKAVTGLNQKRRFGAHNQVHFTAEPQFGIGYQGLRMSLVF